LTIIKVQHVFNYLNYIRSLKRINKINFFTKVVIYFIELKNEICPTYYTK